MTTSLRLNVNELTPDILKAIQLAFKNKDIEIVISEIADETAHLFSSKANKEHLIKSISEVESGDSLTMSVAEFIEKYKSNT
jgi:hypothetical protein